MGELAVLRRRAGISTGLAGLTLLGCSSAGELGSNGAELGSASTPKASAPRAPVVPMDAPRAADGAAASGSTTPGAATGERAIATVDGAVIGADEVFRLLQLSVPDEANNAIRQLVIDRLSGAEAAASGVAVPPAVLERELAHLLADQERKIAESSHGARDLAKHVQQTWGLTRDEYVAIASASLERSLLLERVVLAELARHPRVQLRLLRVKERKLADEIRGKLEQGADFAALARQHSEDGSAREGGIYPPLPTDLPSPLFERTEKLEPSQLSEVQEIATADGPRYRIVQMLARIPADRGDAAARAAAIEELLDGRHLAPLELEAWMRIMEERHAIHLTRLGSADDRR